MKLAFHLTTDPAYDELNSVLRQWSDCWFDASEPDARDKVRLNLVYGPVYVVVHGIVGPVDTAIRDTLPTSVRSHDVAA